MGSSTKTDLRIEQPRSSPERNSEDEDSYEQKSALTFLNTSTSKGLNGVDLNALDIEEDSSLYSDSGITVGETNKSVGSWFPGATVESKGRPKPGPTPPYALGCRANMLS